MNSLPRSKTRWILYDGPAERVTGQRVGTRIILSTVDPDWFAKALRSTVIYQRDYKAGDG